VKRVRHDVAAEVEAAAAEVEAAAEVGEADVEKVSD
jgi:hypothetical protein